MAKCRFPHYLQHIREWFLKAGNEDAGHLPEAVVTALLENGRLTLKQVPSKLPILLESLLALAPARSLNMVLPLRIVLDAL